jgi:2-keto-4-pentenoate hydratase/2-oxohepta-3-ene-1,7-dioic acid hydratase in catechol pathway
MRLARLQGENGEIPVVGTADGTWFDARPITADIDPAFLADGLGRARSALLAGTLAPVRAARFAAPLRGVGKIVCVGLNYADHAAETGAAVPSEPILFLKSPDTIVAADETVLIPPGSRKTDYVIELAVVIGATARYLSGPGEAMDRIAGYTISNDVSEREFQLERGGQWDKGKSCETFNPLGPWIATAEEVPDPQALNLSLRVNGKLRQHGNTSNMIFNVPYLIWYISQFMVLYPGDIINSGTPAGVALGQPGDPFLRAGDITELEIDGLGTQRQRIGQA